VLLACLLIKPEEEWEGEAGCEGPPGWNV